MGISRGKDRLPVDHAIIINELGKYLISYKVHLNIPVLEYGTGIDLGDWIDRVHEIHL